MQDPSIEDFARLRDADCQVGSGDVRLPMRMLSAEPIAGSPRTQGGFRLEFLGPADPVLEQAIMSVAWPSATYDIFMVPIARDARGTRYEAVFF